MSLLRMTSWRDPEPYEVRRVPVLPGHEIFSAYDVMDVHDGGNIVGHVYGVRQVLGPRSVVDHCLLLWMVDRDPDLERLGSLTATRRYLRTFVERDW